MTSSLRYFVLVALLAVLVGVLALGSYFRAIKSDELLENSLNDTRAIIGAYNNTIWVRNHPENVDNPLAAVDYAHETEQFFRGFKIPKITIFSPDLKKLYYSSTSNIITSDGTNRIPLNNLQDTLRGRPVGQILGTSYIMQGNKPLDSKVLVQTIIPIFSADMQDNMRSTCLATAGGRGCTPVALAEIYTDVTSDWESLQDQRLVLSIVIIGAFIVLGGVLIFISGRAGAIIARQHELNLELTAAAARAEAQSKDKSQFLAGVSHELRTPLNAIIGFSEIVKNEARDQLQKVYLDYIEDIYASGRHLLSLINDILDYSKAEAGKLQIEWAETDVTKVMRNSLRMVLPRAETAQVMLIEDIPSGHMIITTDAKKLKQVLLNLLSNAVKFTQPGGEVRCQAWEDLVAQAIIIQVSDTGIGIAPKDIGRVMTPFGQVDSALSRKYEGTGLGLPLAKVFLESMGGTFAIESKLEVGTTITLTLPKVPLASTYHSMQSAKESDVAPKPNAA